MLSLGTPMLNRPAPKAPKTPTSAVPSKAATIQAPPAPAAKIGPTPGITNTAEPNNSPQKPPQNAPVLPQYFGEAESGIKRIVTPRGFAPALTLQDLSRKRSPSSS